jgi:hypothetical protein
MKNNVNEPKVMFQLKGIELVDYKLNQLNQPLSEQTTFHFNISLEQKISPENKLVVVVATVEILHEDKTTQLASLKASCIFEIANFNDFLIEGTNRVTFPDSAVIDFNSLTISTVRGLMFSQFKGTYLHTAILPVIDQSAFIKKLN